MKTEEEDEKFPVLTLANLGHGAAAEQFEMELAKVIENIKDANTEATTKRSIRLEIEFKPSENRGECALSIQASSKLAPFNSAGANIFIGYRAGKPVATSFNIAQQQLDFDRESAPRALPVTPVASSRQA